MKRQLFAIVIAVMLLSHLPCLGAETPGPNRPPIANAGMDQHCGAGEMVFLDGSGSFDPEGKPLSFLWELLYAPEGVGGEVLVNRFSKTGRLNTTKEGMYLVALTVNDGKLYSERDVVQVRADAAPVNPDLLLKDLKALGLFEDKLNMLEVTLQNRGARFEGSVTMNFVALDRLQGGHVSFGKEYQKTLSLEQGEELRMILSRREIQWPVSVCMVSFGVSANAGVIEETKTNNSAQLTEYRDNLFGGCSSRIDALSLKIENPNRPGYFDYDEVQQGENVVLMKGEQNIYMYLTHCCPQADHLQIAVIYNTQASHETTREKNLSFVLDPPGDDASKGDRKEFATIGVSPGQEHARHVLAGVRIPETDSLTTLSIVRKRPGSPFYEILRSFNLTTR